MAAYTDIISIIGRCCQQQLCERGRDRFICCSAVLGRCLAGKVRIRTDHRHRLSLHLVRNRRLGGHALHALPRLMTVAAGAVVASFRGVLRWRSGQLHDDPERREAGPDPAGVSAGREPRCNHRNAWWWRTYPWPAWLLGPDTSASSSWATWFKSSRPIPVVSPAATTAPAAPTQR